MWFKVSWREIPAVGGGGGRGGGRRETQKETVPSFICKVREPCGALKQA